MGHKKECPKLKSLPDDVNELRALKTLELLHLDQLAGSCLCENRDDPRRPC